jgi:putative inorganic carbon (HCO3(-)) transporter
MAEAILNFRYKDSLVRRVQDALPPWGVCALAALIGLIIPELLLRYQMPLVVGAFVGLMGFLLIVTCPYMGLLTFLGLLYLRPEELFPQLEGVRMTLTVSLVSLFAWVTGALLKRERFLLDLPIVRCCFLFAVVAIASTAINVSDFGTVSEVALDMIKLVILFVLVIHLVDSEARLRMAISTILLFTAILGARTIWQYANGEAAVMSDGEMRALGTGIFGDPNDLALAMAMALPFALDMVFTKGRVWPRLWSLATVPILTWTIFVTDSRGGMLALGASIYMFFGRRLGRVGTIVGAVAVLALFTFGPSRMSQMSADEESAQGRVQAWEAGLEMLKSSPLWGVGKEQFIEHHYLTAHNSFVLCMGELGLIGTGLWVGLFYFSIRDGRRVAKAKANPAATGGPVPDPLLPIPVKPEKKAWNIRTYPALMQMCLITFMVGGFFLSRTYTPPLYVYLGLAVAAARIEADRSGEPMPTSQGRDWRNIALITVAGWVVVNILVRVWSR